MKVEKYNNIKKYMLKLTYRSFHYVTLVWMGKKSIHENKYTCNVTNCRPGVFPSFCCFLSSQMFCMTEIYRASRPDKVRGPPVASQCFTPYFRVTSISLTGICAATFPFLPVIVPQPTRCSKWGDGWSFSSFSSPTWDNTYFQVKPTRAAAECRCQTLKIRQLLTAVV